LTIYYRVSLIDIIYKKVKVRGVVCTAANVIKEVHFITIFY